MSIHERAIIKPRDPSITNSDDWPIFSIKSAHIFDPLDPTAELCNLLHAGAYRPLTIAGKLEPLSDETRHLLLKPSYPRSQPIEVTDVRQFSYGQYEDGSVDIWAAGQAGWYTISPSRAYKQIYADMVQAVQLLYFAADAYKDVKKPSQMDAQDLFQKYCLENADTCGDFDEAEKLFVQHRYFLFASMLDNKEGLQWSRIPIFKYLEANFPDDVALIRQRRAFAMKPPASSSSKRGTKSPVPSNASLKRKRERNDRSNPSATAATRRSHSRSVSVVTATPSMVSAAGLPQRASSRRPSSQLSSAPPKSGNNESDADSEESTERPLGHKGKSVLRPRPTKYLNNRHLEVAAADGNDADDDETDTPRDAVQTSPTSKRKMVDDLRSRRAKRRNSEKPPHDADELMIDDLDRNAGEGDNESVATPSEAYQDANESMGEDKRPTLPFRFRDGKTEEDNGDVWRCSTDGCTHRVYAASEPASQTLIEDHQRTHEYDGDTRVQLVRRMEAPWLPVGRLMDRVRELAAQSGGPAPVVRRY